MHADKYLVVPVLEAKQRTITTYLPVGCQWKLWDSELTTYNWIDPID